MDLCKNLFGLALLRVTGGRIVLGARQARQSQQRFRIVPVPHGLVVKARRALEMPRRVIDPLLWVLEKS